MTRIQRTVIGGVDTHKDTLAVCAMDATTGQVLATGEFAAAEAGYRAVLTWLRGHGALARVGVEGTSSYGAGLTRP